MNSVQKNHKKSIRFFGLDLSGAKNHKTCLCILDYFPKENKSFLMEAIEGNDADITETLLKHKTESPQICAVNAALTLPPLFQKASLKKNSDLIWMEKIVKKASQDKRSTIPKIKSFTPYTQRPIELWLRYEVLPKIPNPLHFEIDETMGGTRAPLTARMFYLKKYLNKIKFIEALPKLSLTVIARELKIPSRFLLNYRSLENGSESRIIILDKMAEKLNLFFYTKDLKILTENLGAFDAFICAYTAVLYKSGNTQQPPRHFPLKSGWIHYPQL